MKVVEQLGDFYEVIAADPRMGTRHICLYLALLHEGGMQWQQPIGLSRGILLQKACMSRKSYYTTLKELQTYGYIRYQPSTSPLERSVVYLNRL